jgi:hypothetical protein
MWTETVGKLSSFIEIFEISRVSNKSGQPQLAFLSRFRPKDMSKSAFLTGKISLQRVRINAFAWRFDENEDDER